MSWRFMLERRLRELRQEIYLTNPAKKPFEIEEKKKRKEIFLRLCERI